MSNPIDVLASVNRGIFRAAAAAYRDAAARARNCSHSCVSEKHCDFLHAAHERLAKELEECAKKAEVRP
jgi:hypothetical protein